MRKEVEEIAQLGPMPDSMEDPSEELVGKYQDLLDEIWKKRPTWEEVQALIRLFPPSGLFELECELEHLVEYVVPNRVLLSDVYLRKYKELIEQCNNQDFKESFATRLNNFLRQYKRLSDPETEKQHENMNEITQHVWGFTPESPSGEGGGEPVILYTMTNSRGGVVQLTNYGAAIVGITVPDREGRMDDVVLGYREWASYVGDGPAMGKSVGRYANRIARGTFTLDGTTYKLAINNGPNHLHGGPTGFANRLWEGRVEGDRVVFGYHSADGEEGYPGALYVEACYDWDDDNRLEITYYARVEGAATIVNLTNHVYFNLDGHDKGSVLDHRLTLHAANYLPTDETAIPLAAPQSPASVEGTPMDFRTAHMIGERIDEPFQQLVWGKGYDHCWVIDPGRADGVATVAELYSPKSGRFVEVATTQPGIQIYTGNWLSGCPDSKEAGCHYKDRYGVAMECQAFPDSPNRADFPSVVLRPGETYERHIVYRFGTR